MDDDVITIADGSGGIKTFDLLKNVILPSVLSSDGSMEDGALLDGTDLVFTTDSFTVNPLFFPGGDIGKLSVYGTVNDLAVMGASPNFLSLSFIIEEGLPRRILDSILGSIGCAVEEVGIKLVCGDTKVMPRGGVDRIVINTSGVGRLISGKPLVARRAKVGYDIVVSGDVGRHEMAVLLSRGEFGIEADIESDLAPIYNGVKALIEANVGLVFARDLTRGGLAMALYELALASNTRVVVDEECIPVNRGVVGLCEVLGFEPVFLACEGTFIAVVGEGRGKEAVEVLKQAGYENASRIGVLEGGERLGDVERVIMITRVGSPRLMPLPTGELTPRIC